MTYEEFTTYLAELAQHYYDNFTTHATPQYVVSKVQEEGTHISPLAHVKYIPELQRILTFERNSKKLRIYNLDLKCELILLSPHGNIHMGNLSNDFSISLSYLLVVSLLVEYIPPYHMLLASTEDHYIVTWDCQAYAEAVHQDLLSRIKGKKGEGNQATGSESTTVPEEEDRKPMMPDDLPKIILSNKVRSLSPLSTSSALLITFCFVVVGHA